LGNLGAVFFVLQKLKNPAPREKDRVSIGDVFELKDTHLVEAPAPPR